MCYYVVRRSKIKQGIYMRRSVIAALGAAVIAMLGASSAAQAGTIDFGVVGIGGTIGNTGTDLEESTAIDLDESTLFVSGVGPGDEFRAGRLRHGLGFCSLAARH